MNRSGAAATLTKVRGVDWTGQKRVTLQGRLQSTDTTVGELAEEIRIRLGLEPGSYGVYFDDAKLNRTDTLFEAGVVEDAEIELSPEAKAGCAAAPARSR